MNKAKYEKLIDDTQDAERGDRWENFKSGLDLGDEWQMFLDGLSKDELIELINDNDEVYNNSTDDLDDWLREVYDGKY